MIRWPFGKKDQPNKEGEEEKYNKQIQDALHKEENAFDGMIYLLFLGSGDSGKSTLMKQIKRIHLGEDESQRDRIMSKNYIGWSLVTYMKILCQASSDLEQMSSEEKTSLDKVNAQLSEKILTISVDLATPVPKSLIGDVKTLWNDVGIQRTFALKDYYLLPDGCEYFMSRADDIGKDDYIPTFEDYIRTRHRSTGVNVCELAIKTPRGKQFMFQFTDVGGQKSERRKWLALMKQTIDCVIFVVGTSEYNQYCFEDNQTLRMHDSLDAFEAMAKEKFFNEKTLILFFNKYDLFIEKLKKYPVDKYFKDWPEDKDSTNETHVLDFFFQQYNEKVVKNKVDLSSPLFRHVVTALDTNMVNKIFRSVSSDLVNKNLKDLGVM